MGLKVFIFMIAFHYLLKSVKEDKCHLAVTRAENLITAAQTPNNITGHDGSTHFGAIFG